jgi:hypothetical protein
MDESMPNWRSIATRLVGALLVIWVSCITDAAASSTARNEACDWSAEVPSTVAEARLVIFGEIHGTNEIPALVGEFACWRSAQSQDIILGLEIHQAEQQAIDTYLSSAGTMADQERLTSGDFWKRIKDGRSSEAMLRLIDRVRRLQGGPGAVGIVAFDSGRYDASREAAMAENLQASMRMHPHYRFVVLVGNAHAAKDSASPAADSSSEHMAQKISSERPITINAEYLTGTAWLWAPAPAGGGVNKVGGWRKADTPAGFHMGVAGMPGFDGSFALGSITASLPAVR